MDEPNCDNVTRSDIGGRWDDLCIPECMIRWMNSRISGSQILHWLNIHLFHSQNFNSPMYLKRLVWSLARVIFTAEFLADVMDLNPEGVLLLEKILYKHHRYFPKYPGSPCIPESACIKKSYSEEDMKLFILSNMDKLTFQHLLRNPRINTIIGVFDHVLISGELGVCKPSQEAYKMALDTWKIPIPSNQKNKCEIVLIDDCLKNVECAMQLGFQGIHFQ
jgi:FMN phosphatase YigB (HAD superfamily)